MFHDISKYIPLEKELKRFDFRRREILQRVYSPEYIYDLKNYMGIMKYYDFVVSYNMMEKLDNEIKFLERDKEEYIRRKLSRCDDINVRIKKLESVEKEGKERFLRQMKLLFGIVFSFIIEKGNLEMMKFLLEKYGEYVALIDDISVREKDINVMKYIIKKGLDKQIKIKDRKEIRIILS